MFCGSDELLRQMVLVKSNSVWRKKIFESATGVRIGHIKEVKEGQTDEFLEMIENDNAVVRPGLKYSVAALETLSIYSDRVPLYAKEICNTVLGEIKRISGIRQFGRNIIYSYDVSAATQNLMDIQNYALTHSLEESHKERIVKIYDAVTKGLEEDTDKQYLWLMAKWFMENPSKVVFDFKEYTEKEGYRLLESDSGLRDRLEVACVRGIIRGSEEIGYMFSTPFYYSAFCGTVQNLNLSNILVKEDNAESKNNNQRIESNPLTVLRDDFKVLSEIDRAEALHLLYGLLSPESKQSVRDSFGSQQYGDIVQGNKIGRQNNVQLNVQSITNILNGIFAANGDSVKLIEGLQSLPRLGSYLPQSDSESDNQEVTDERLSRAIDNYVADMEESLEISNEISSIGENISFYKILQLPDEETFEEFKEHYNLPDFFLNSLKFAYQLDTLFLEGAVGDTTDSIDYSPVTIMYCKLIEGLLKEYHINVYSRCLSNVLTDLGKLENRKQKYNWGEIRGLPIQQQQRLTIGSFVFPLRKPWAIGNIIRVTHQEQEEWEAHKHMISSIRDIRNSSAHGNKGHRISLDQKEEINRLLFDERGFMRLIELALG